MEDNNSNADKNSCILDAPSESSYILTDFMEKVTQMQIVPMSEGMEIGRGGGDEMNALNLCVRDISNDYEVDDTNSESDGSDPGEHDVDPLEIIMESNNDESAAAASVAIVQTNSAAGEILLKSSELAQVDKIGASGLVESEVTVTSNNPTSTRDGTSVAQVQVKGVTESYNGSDPETTKVPAIPSSTPEVDSTGQVTSIPSSTPEVNITGMVTSTLSSTDVGEDDNSAPTNPASPPAESAPAEVTPVIPAGTVSGSALVNASCTSSASIPVLANTVNTANGGSEPIIKDCSVVLERWKPDPLDEWPEDYNDITLKHYARMTVTDIIPARYNVHKAETARCRIKFRRSDNTVKKRTYLFSLVHTMVQNVLKAFSNPNKFDVKDILAASNFVASYTDVFGQWQIDIQRASNEIFQLGGKLLQQKAFVEAEVAKGTRTMAYIDKLYGRVRRMESEVSKKQQEYLMLLGVQQEFHKDLATPMIGINVIGAFSTVYAVEAQKKTNDPEPRPGTSREITRAGGVSQRPLAKAERNKCQWCKKDRGTLMKTAPSEHPAPSTKSRVISRAWMNEHRNDWCPDRPPAWKTNTWCPHCKKAYSSTTNLKRHQGSCPGLKSVESSKKRKKSSEDEEDWKTARKKKKKTNRK